MYLNLNAKLKWEAVVNFPSIAIKRWCENLRKHLSGTFCTTRAWTVLFQNVKTIHWRR